MNRGPNPATGLPVRALTVVGAASLAAMMLWTIADVVLRAVAHRALDGTVAIVETLLVLVAFFALADCMARDEMIRVDILDNSVGRRTLGVLKVLGDVATLAFLGLLIFTLLTPLADAWRFGDVKPDLPVPIWSLLAAIELSLAAAALVVAGRLLRLLRRRFTAVSRGAVVASEAGPNPAGANDPAARDGGATS